MDVEQQRAAPSSKHGATERSKQVGTVHQDAVEYVTERIIAGEHGPKDEWMQVITETTVKLTSGFYTDADFYFQNYYGKPVPDVYDTVAFLLARQDVFNGKTWVCDIVIKETPGPDSDVEGNNQKLSLLKTKFSDLKAEAQFIPGRGGGANNDGYFSFEDMRFYQFNPDNEVVDEKKFSFTLPLEVGTTAASKTLLHIRTHGVARWPYHSDTIRVFYTPNGLRLWDDE